MSMSPSPGRSRPPRTQYGDRPLARRRVATVWRRPLGFASLLALILTLAACASGDGGTRPDSAGRAATSVATVAAAAPATATPAAFPFTLTGSDGGSVKLAKAPERIVSLSAGATEALFAIGAGPRVVAVDKFSDYPEATKNLPKLEYTRPSVEALAGLRPDLIIAAGRQKDTVPAIQAAGLPVVLLEEPVSVKAVLEQVRLLGQATGQSNLAAELATTMDRRIKAVTDKLAGASRGPRVFHELSSDFFSAAPSSFVGDLYTLLKAQNIAEGAAGSFPKLSQEVIVQRDPEVIIHTDGYEVSSPDVTKARPGWSAISAVKSGRIHILSDDQSSMASRPGPRLVDALELLAKLLYPDRF